MSVTFEGQPLDYVEQVARIERAQEETRKFAAEQHKLTAEAAKLTRDRTLAPTTLFLTSVGIVLTSLGSGFIGGLLTHYLH